ncbi:MAG: hypothetical protein CMJ18_19025 [Phycisphaeraceae bacterium]|nr:hypothetical protein [Phycisphaeraceae bacterium]
MKHSSESSVSLPATLGLFTLVSAVVLAVASLVTGPMSAIGFAVAVAWLAAVVGFLPMQWSAQRDPHAWIGAAMLGMAFRPLFCLTVGLTGAWLRSWPLEPVLLVMAAAYLALLLVEVVLVVTHLSRRPGDAATEACS